MAAKSVTSYRYMRWDRWENLTTGTSGNHGPPASSQYAVGNNISSGSSNPSYRVQIVRGQDASTSYSRTGWEIKRPSYQSISILGRSGPNLYRSTGRDTFMNVPSWSQLSGGASDTALRDIALARLKKRLANEVKAFKALAPLAELHHVRGLLRQIASLGWDMLMALAKARKTQGVSIDNFVADTWLAFSFGAKPLVSDVSGLCESIAGYLTRVDHKLRLSGTANKRWKQMSYTDQPNGSTLGCLFASIRTSYTVHASLGYRFVSGFQLALESGNQYSVSDHFGLNLGDSLSAAYQLTPWSWLIDYFTTTGAFFEDVFQSPGASTSYVVECRKYEAIIDTSSVYVPPAGFVVEQQTPGFGQVRVFDFRRTPLSSLPHRTLRFKTVDEIGLNAVNRLLNLAALFLKHSSR